MVICLFFKSSSTSDAEQSLKDVDSTNLKNFLNIKFKDIKAESINSIKAIFNAIPYDIDEHSVDNFVDKLDGTRQNTNFFDAIKKQAKSFGDEKSGLFYKPIYRNINQKIKSNSNWNDRVGTLK